MKRTLNINIGNSIIHIEEDAYELLTSYLNEIKAHFARNADDFEIVTDIENRIAEMFLEILSMQQKQVISIEDVQLIMAQMGRVSDFETGEEAAEQVDTTLFNRYQKIIQGYRTGYDCRCLCRSGPLFECGSALDQVVCIDFHILWVVPDF